MRVWSWELQRILRGRPKRRRHYILYIYYTLYIIGKSKDDNIDVPNGPKYLEGLSR